jgi:hypothetical protein
VFTSSCDVLDQEPKDFYSPNNFYTSAEGAEAAVKATYAALYDNDGGRWPVNLLGLPSDNMHSPAYVPFERKHQLDEYTYGSENADIRRFWSGVYEVISFANTAIQNIQNIDMDADEKERLIGEANFLRGWQYFILEENFGAVPLILGDNLNDLEVEAANTPASEIYQQIISDLQSAEAALPDSWSGNDAGRATSGAASSFLAKVYLTLASYQTNDIFPDRTYAEDAQTYYQMAADKAKEIIDSGTYNLFSDYKDNFRLDTENGIEHIFSFQHARTEHANIINFFSVPFECGLTPAAAEGEFIPTLDLYNAYPEADYRRNVNLIDECTTPDGEQLTFQDWAAPVPHIFKYYDRGTDPLDLRNLNTPVMRYAEILLIYAEALNELGRTGEAYEYINMVRERARNGSPGASPQDISAGSLSQAEFRDAIFLERRLEFPFEAGIRKNDLDRSGRLKETLCKPNAAESFVFGCENVEDYHVLFAIPARELELNSLLQQNPGFN